jgi:hypothetical protein
VGNNKTILGLVVLIAAICVLFSVRNKTAEVSQNQGYLVSENNTEQTELEANSRLFDSHETAFLPEPEDSDSPVISSSSQDDIVPRIARFFQTGEMNEIRDLPREDIRIAIDAYVSMQSKDQLAETLHQYLGMPYGLFSDKPEDYLMKMVDLVREDVDQSPPRSNLIITDVCAADGSVSGAVHIIPSGSSRIYAVFENRDTLQGIDTIYAVWRNLNDDSLTFSEYEPLRIGSAYNYVWLDLKDGWSAGAYQLDLADPASPSRILATTKFKVQ